MLPPVPHSRQSSYNLTSPLRASLSRSAHTVHIINSNDEDEEGSNFHNHGESSTPLRRQEGDQHVQGDEGEEAGDDEEGEDDEQLVDNEEAEMMREIDQLDGATRERGLEETLEKIGFGAYHWRLLALCGFGWMSDNSALTCIALILPRVQIHYDLSARTTGLLSASTMAGMMIGAVTWGVLSDVLGRAIPFNATLFLTAVFGMAASFSSSFWVLCVWMFLLGTAVGGSMPTDGTLFVENLPNSKHYLLTFLSIFFSIGAVVSAAVSAILLPGASCGSVATCDVANGENDGWRRVLFVLGVINLACACARFLLFKLHESPRYLVSNGRENEAVVVLRAIANFNAHDIDIEHADVQEAKHHHHHSNQSHCNHDDERGQGDANGNEHRYKAVSIEDGLAAPLSRTSSRISMEERRPFQLDERSPSRSAYETFGDGPELQRLPLEGIGITASRPGLEPFSTSFYPPTSSFHRDHEPIWSESDQTNERRSDVIKSGGSFGVGRPEDAQSTLDGDLSTSGLRNKRRISGRNRHGEGKTERGWAKQWYYQIAKLFVPRWRRTVILMWIIWSIMSFAYTMFNVWLPAVLENRAGEGDDAIRSALRNFVFYSVAGCPGSVIGAWMVQTRLGRRKSLAICTAITAFSMFAFIGAKNDLAVIVSSMVIAAAATAMYAVLYGMTPEAFGTSIRGTACGTSSALSRLTGIMAPVSAGMLLSISTSIPVFFAAICLGLTAGCALLLPFEKAGVDRTGSTSFAH